MSIPLRAACCAATVAIALAPGVSGAQAAEHSSSARLHGNQFSRTALDAHLLAGLQRAVRVRRARLVTQWQRQASRAVRFARSQRGVPYKYGGTGRGGYDCSGLVQRAWRRAGVTLPRVAHDQFRRARTRVSAHRLRPGDLVLFNHLSHVGIYVGRGRFIHSPRSGRTVTTEPLRGYWQHRFVGAVRPAWPRLPAVPTKLY